MKDFLQHFEIIYKKFVEQASAAGRQTSELAFARFLGANRGSMQAWKKGRIPNSRDLLAMHDKLGFAMRWLITGEGDPYGEDKGEGVAALQAEIASLKEELAQADRLNRQLAARLLLESDAGAQSTDDVA